MMQVNSRYFKSLSSFFETIISAKALPVIAVSCATTIFQLLHFSLITKYLSVSQFAEYRIFMSVVSFNGLFHIGYLDGLVLCWVVDNKTPAFHQVYFLFFVSILTPLVFIFYPVTSISLVFVIAFITVSNLLAFINNILIRNRYFTSPLLFILGSQIVLVLYFWFTGHSLKVKNIVVLSLGFNLILTISIFIFAIKKNFISTKRLWSPGIILESMNAIKAGIPILLLALFFVSIFNLDKILLSTHYSKSYFGYYLFASSAITILVGILSSPASIIFIRITNCDSIGLAKLYFKVYFYIAVVSLMSIFFIPLFFLIGERYLPKFHQSFGFLIGYCFIIFPVLILQLLINNVFKKYKASGRFLKVSLFFLTLFIGYLVVLSNVFHDLLTVPFVLAQILIICSVCSEFSILKINPYFKKGFVFRMIFNLFYNVLLIVAYFYVAS